MIAEATKLAARDIDLLALAQRYGVVLHRHGADGELAGPCPCPGCTSDHNGFHISTRRNRWKCYTCHREQWYDAAELVKICEGLNFPDAIQWLTGDSTAAPRIAKRAQPVQQQPERAKVWSADERNRAAGSLEQWQGLLWNGSAAGERARSYLEERGLDDATVLNFRLGCTAGTKQYPAAITIPWYAGGQLVCIRYRYLEPQDGNRYGLWGSPGNRLYGHHANVDPADTVVIVEGEVNALSIWQVAHHTRLHVLSTGTQVDRVSEAAVRAIAARYSTVIIWADEPAVSAKLQQQVAGQARGMVGAMHSPVQDGVKLDANALLQRGELGGILSEYREQLTQQQGALDRLYSDLLHGATSMQGLDGGSADVLQLLAARANMPLEIEQPEQDRWVVFR